MTEKEQLQIIEALLFASPEPLTQQKLNLVFEADAPALTKMIPKLRSRFENENRPLQILDIAGGYQINTQPEFEVYIRRLLNKSGKLTLSQAALETLAIVAYKQPVNRYDIEAIRGVDCTGVLKTILDKNLIRISGRDEAPGRPLLYSTTESFLEFFGLNRISDLPRIKEINELTALAAPAESFVNDHQIHGSELDKPVERPIA